MYALCICLLYVLFIGLCVSVRFVYWFVCFSTFCLLVSVFLYVLFTGLHTYVHFICVVINALFIGLRVSVRLVCWFACF